MIYGIFPALIIHHKKDDRLFLKHDRVFKKDDRVLKKRGHPSICHSERRIAERPHDAIEILRFALNDIIILQENPIGVGRLYTPSIYHSTH